MAYRRKQGIQRSATFVEDHRRRSSGDPSSPAIASPRSTRFADDSRRPERSLAAQALLASAASGDVPALAERFPTSSSSLRSSPRAGRPSDQAAQDPITLLYTSMSGSNDEALKKDEAKQGLWGLLAQQAKVMLDENGSPEEGRNQSLGTSGGIQPSQSRWSYDRVRKSESPTFQKGSEGVKLDIGGKIKNALEEGLTTMAENRTAAVGRKLQIRRKACSMDMRNTNLNLTSPDMSPMLTDFESPQIKASRDVASAMAAKVKLLQRELKTLKADLAFSKERCSQLEEENRLLRDGNHDADEDLIRQQLETLLAEKARLANENTVYARENRFLREIVEFHQLNDVDVNLNEDIEEEDEEEEEDVDQGRPCDDLRTLSSPLCRVQEEAEHTPVTPGTAPQTACHTDEVPTSGTDRGDAVDVTESPMRRSSKDKDVTGSPMRRSSKDNDVTGSPLRRSSKDDSGSPETSTPIRKSFNDDNCSPEMATDD